MTTIKLRRGLAAQWLLSNPLLDVGEPGFEIDTGKFKLGDGVTLWANLDYYFPESDLEALYSSIEDLNTALANEVDRTNQSYVRLSDIRTVVNQNGSILPGQHNPIDASLASVAMSLGDASSGGKITTVEKIDSTTNSVAITLNLRGSVGAVYTLVGQFESVMLLGKADGSWWPVAGHKTKTWIDAEILAQVAASPTVTSAAAAAASTAVSAEVAARSLVDTNDARLPNLSPRRGFKDPSDRFSLWEGDDGVWHFGLPIVAPGQLEINASPGWSGIYDPITDRWSENTVDSHGNLVGLSSALTRIGLNLGATRRAGVALTTSGGTNIGNQSAETGKHVRYPFRVAPSVKRFRIHLRNYNERQATAYSPVAASDMYFGLAARDSSGLLSGSFLSTPVKVASAVSVPGASEVVTPWYTANTDKSSPYLLSFSYTCSSQINHYGIGGGWLSSGIGEEAMAVPTTALARQTANAMPLAIWIEVEVDASVPVFAGLGDSLSAGTGSSLPAYDSWISKHALACGAIPQLYTNHGSALEDWQDPAHVKYTKYLTAGCDKPDALVIGLGSNSIASLLDTSTTMQPLFLQIVANVRSVITSKVFAATIMPRSLATGPEAERIAYNNWLLGLPAEIVNVYDFATSVADPANVAQLLSRYNSGDATHLNTAGYAANARAITEPCV